MRALEVEIGNPLLGADDSSGNPGDIIFDATTALVTTTGVISGWSFFDDDDLEPNAVVTPMILRHVAGSDYEITGIGLTRTSTEMGVQTYPFDLQSGSDQVVAEGSYFFEWRNANPDGSLLHLGGIDVTFAGNSSFFSVSADVPTAVGSFIAFNAFGATSSYAATLTVVVPEPDAVLLAVGALAALAVKGRSRPSRRNPFATPQ